MNLREGTRRLALLLGGAGAITGCALGYLYLQPIVRQRDLHNSFERFANSDVVKEQRKILQSPDPYAEFQKPAFVPPPDFIPAAPDFIPATPTQPSAQPELDWTTAQPVGQLSKPNTNAPTPPSGNTSPATPDYAALAAKYGGIQQSAWSKAVPVSTQVTKGGITTINWGHDYGVASIETTNGETLSPMPAPTAWQYALAALFPLLGFLIPWGAIRAIGWVLTGFVQPSK